MNKKILIDDKFGKVGNAGSKARRDVHEILVQQLGYTLLEMPGKNPENRLVKEALGLKFQQQVLSRIARNDTLLLIEYPVYNMSLTRLRALVNRAKQKGAKTIALIHDLDSIRHQVGDRIFDEVKTLNLFQVVITHNQSMSKFLGEKGLASKCIELGLFDYLFDESKQYKSHFEKVPSSVFFAGNLNKSSFVQQIKSTDNVEYQLYGRIDDKSLLDGVSYHGMVDEDEIPMVLRNGWGLVWDGTNLDVPDSGFGEYLRIIDSHKCSLYLVAGLPLIVWRESAVSQFVQDMGVGVVIDSVNDLEKVVSATSPDTYNQMLANVLKVADRLQNGKMTTSAVQAAESFLNN